MKEEPQPPPREIETIIARNAARAGVPASLAYAVAWVESRYDSRAESPAGALGLFQLMPVTIESMGVRDPTDPEQSARAGLDYLAAMFRRFGNWPAALAAYNWGPGNMSKAIEAGKSWPESVQRKYIDPVLDATAQFGGGAPMPAPDTERMPAPQPMRPMPTRPQKRRAVAAFVAALAALAAWRLSQ